MTKQEKSPTDSGDRPVHHESYGVTEIVCAVVDELIDHFSGDCIAIPESQARLLADSVVWRLRDGRRHAQGKLIEM